VKEQMEKGLEGEGKNIYIPTRRKKYFKDFNSSVEERKSLSETSKNAAM
jgi:hypothetical protein